jgi:hypothetical protein
LIFLLYLTKCAKITKLLPIRIGFIIKKPPSDPPSSSVDEVEEVAVVELV